tara:strand:+ start:346 stop:663 length:318 start_codon:yes stop_codon:yes gene_type:complete
MSVPKTDWDQEIKFFLETYFEVVESPLDADQETEKHSIASITKKVMKVLPSQYIYEDDVYNVLLDLGFKMFSYEVPPVFDEKTGKELKPAYTDYAYFLKRKTAAL